MHGEQDRGRAAHFRAWRRSSGRRTKGAARTPAARKAQEPLPGVTDNAIVIRHAREHNLKNIDLSLPRDAFSVITGVSGSGKSTIAFDILFAEGQRRYLESLNAYARQFVQPARRPDVDGVYGVPPTVAIEQRTSRGGRKSTVATLTEMYPFLRLLFVKLGVQHCPDCGVPIQPQTPGCHRRAAAARVPGQAGHRARPSGHRAQGLLHGPRRLGRGQGLRAPARGRGAASHRGLAAAGPVQGAHDRASRREREVVSAERERPLRELLARGLDFGKGVIRVVAAARGRAGAGGRRDRLLHPARLPALRAGASRSWTRACSPTTPSTAGVLPASARACSSRGSTPSRPARRSGGTTGGAAPRRPAPPATASASGPRRLR